MNKLNILKGGALIVLSPIIGGLALIATTVVCIGLGGFMIYEELSKYEVIED